MDDFQKAYKLLTYCVRPREKILDYKAGLELTNELYIIIQLSPAFAKDHNALAMNIPIAPYLS